MPKDVREVDVPKLTDAIAKAFAQVPRPEDKDYTSSTGGEDYEESSQFFGKDWHTLSPDFLHTYRDVLFWFKPEAFLYYLPAFLNASIVADDENAIYVHTILQLLKKKSENSFSRARWGQLSDDQIRVLHEWLKWVLSKAPPGGVFAGEINEAIDTIKERRWWSAREN